MREYVRRLTKGKPWDVNIVSSGHSALPPYQGAEFLSEIIDPWVKLAMEKSTEGLNQRDLRSLGITQKLATILGQTYAIGCLPNHPDTDRQMTLPEFEAWVLSQRRP